MSRARRRRKPHARLKRAAAVMVALLIAVTGGAAAVPGVAAAAAAFGARGAREMLANFDAHPWSAGRPLPPAAAGPVSRMLGQAEPGYAVTRDAAGLAVRNPAQRLSARFAAAGVTIRAGRLRVTLRLRGYGRGTRLAPPAVPVLTGNKNQVRYQAGPLTQWYANGPLGLEQGFTLAARPAAGPGPLTFSLAVGAGTRVTAATGGALFSGAGRALSYRGLVVTDARRRRLPATVTVRGHRLTLTADDAGAVYPVTVDPLFSRLATLTAAGGAAGDELGAALAVSGNTVVAGAPDATVSGHAGQGAVYLFTMPAGGWSDETQSALLTAGHGVAGANFGSSVAISGNTVAVGAPAASVGSHASQGAVYVFAKPHGGWPAEMTSSARLTVAGGATADDLGWSVAWDGRAVVAGAPRAAVRGHTGQGAVYVFAPPPGGWAGHRNQSATLTAAGGAAGELLGDAVAVAGTAVVAGAPMAAVSAHPGQGAAYVFPQPGGGWAGAQTQAATLTAADGASGDALGSEVAAQGATVVLGAPNATVRGHADQGAAYVFTASPGGWSGDVARAAKLTAAAGGAGDRFASALAVSGVTVVVGAPFAAVTGNAQPGAAYVFTAPAGGWAGTVTGAVTVTAAGGAASDRFGAQVGLAGGRVAVGAPGASARAHAQGAAYVFGGGVPSAAQPPGG